MTTGADLERARRAATLIEAGLIEFLHDIEVTLVNSMAQRLLLGTLSDAEARDAWIKLGEIRSLKSEAERRARLLTPMVSLLAGGPPP
jgi:hypothetical protein